MQQHTCLDAVQGREIHVEQNAMPADFEDAMRDPGRESVQRYHGSSNAPDEITMTGYSGTPLAQKLGIKPGVKLHTLSAPDNYKKLLAPLPEGVQFVQKLGEDTDIVHVFATGRAKLKEALRSTLAKMRQDAAIWVSWPKKAAKAQTDVTEDVVREIALPLGLVDIKVCAVDETWSGLKLVIRKDRRK